MKEQTINAKQAISIITKFMFGTAIIMGGNSPAKQDSWIAMLLAVCMAMPLFFVYARIIKLCPGKDLFDIAIDLFGNITGKFIVLLFTWYSIHLGAMISRSFADFIQVVAVPQTPLIPILLFMGSLSVYAVKSGLVTLGKCALFLQVFTIIIVLLTTVLAVKNMDFSNFLPIGGQGVKSIVKSAYVLFIVPFSEAVLFTCIASSLTTEASPYKIYYTALLVTGTIFLLTTVRNSAVIGFPILNSIRYTSYAVMRIVSVGDFLERIEATISLVFITAGFVKISVCLFVASKGLTKLFGFENYRQMANPAFLTTIALSTIVAKNSMDMETIINAYKYYALLFVVILPTLILIAAEIKHRKKIVCPSADSH